MKKFGCIALCLCLLLSLAGCGGKTFPQEAVIDLGDSAIYTEEDRQAAAAAIWEEFQAMGGCELHSLSYAGDDCNSEKNIQWMNKLEAANDAAQVFTQCIAFDSSFRSPKNGGGAWEPNAEYTWSWWLARSEGGQWKLMTWGYC